MTVVYCRGNFVYGLLVAAVTFLITFQSSVILSVSCTSLMAGFAITPSTVLFSDHLVVPRLPGRTWRFRYEDIAEVRVVKGTTILTSWDIEIVIGGSAVKVLQAGKGTKRSASHEMLAFRSGLASMIAGASWPRSRVMFV